MSWLSRLHVGMSVQAEDGMLGSIASVPRVDLGDPSAPAEVIVLALQENAGPGVEEFRRVTRDMVDRVEADTLYLNRPRQTVPRASEAVASAHRRLRDEVREISIPLVEEQVQVDTRVVELGYVQVRKRVDEFMDEQIVPLRFQEVEVERVAVDRVIPEVLEPYMDGDVYVVPVIEEEVIVARQLRLKEELRIRRQVGQQDETIRTPFRRERVTVEQHWYDSPSNGEVAATDPMTNTSASAGQ